MPNPTSWLRVRHLSAVFALVAAPLAGVLWSFLVPLFTGMEQEVANVAAQPGRWIAGTYAGVLMSFLMVPAALAQGRLLRRDSPVAGDVASTVCAAGACFHGGLLVFQLAEAAIVAAIPERAFATTVVMRLFEHPAFVLILAPFVGFYAGLAALALLMMVRRSVPRWIPALVLVAIPIEFVGPMAWKARLFFVLLTVAFTGLAASVWRLGAMEWARRASAPLPEGVVGAPAPS